MEKTTDLDDPQRRRIHLLRKIKDFTRSIVGDLAGGRSPEISINKYQNYCTNSDGNCRHNLNVVFASPCRKAEYSCLLLGLLDPYGFDILTTYRFCPMIRRKLRLWCTDAIYSAKSQNGDSKLELERMLEKGVKFEIEALSVRSLSFLTQEYLPAKIQGEPRSLVFFNFYAHLLAFLCSRLLCFISIEYNWLPRR
ncbi:Meiotic recombination protein SPO11-1-like protein [Drosera capensis]